jgi:hypothetical protein
MQLVLPNRGTIGTNFFSVYFSSADGASWSRWKWEQLADEGESINLIVFWFVGFTHGRLLLLYSIDWLSTSLSSP